MKLGEAVKILSGAGIENAREEARCFFRQIGGIEGYRLVSGDAECDSSELLLAIERRAKREPLQYILGEVDFYRERYRVSPDCLIPRQDTEALVELAVRSLPAGARFLDLCTGSGCVAISVLKNTERTYAYGYDISSAAVALALENARLNGVAERFSAECTDLMESVPDITGIYAVLSNPPYVADGEYARLEREIFHEPKGAFVGGADGGDFYRRFIPIYKNIIDKNGFLAFEIGYDQRELMQRLAAENSMSLEIIKDLSGNDRVAVLRFA